MDGIAFPYELLFIWILSLCVFVYVRFFLRPPVDISLDAKVKRYAFPIHVFALVVAFLLLDMEVNILFGISALTSLVSQGASMITAVFFILEIIIWIFGYLIFSNPPSASFIRNPSFPWYREMWQWDLESGWGFFYLVVLWILSPFILQHSFFSD